MAITVDVKDQCSAGHGKVTITAGANSRTIIFNKADVLDPFSDEELELGILLLLRFLKIASNSTNWAQMKTNFNNRSISL